MGQKAYTLLRSVFPILPSIQTIDKLLVTMPLHTRLTALMKRHLRNIAAELSAKDKVCVLLWDECSIQPKVNFDEKSGTVEGVEDWRLNKTDEHDDMH